MRTFLVGTLLAAGLAASAAPAGAQDTTVSAEPAPRLSDLRFNDLAGALGPTPPSVQDAPQELQDNDDDESTRDSLRNGTLTGLVVGGIVGAVLAFRCGHPECGPLFSFSAGIGAAIGVAIDAMFTERAVVPIGSTRARPGHAPFDRAVTVGMRKTW
jgi:hypothetical protein